MWSLYFCSSTSLFTSLLFGFFIRTKIWVYFRENNIVYLKKNSRFKGIPSIYLNAFVPSSLNGYKNRYQTGNWWAKGVRECMNKLADRRCGPTKTIYHPKSLIPTTFNYFKLHYTTKWLYRIDDLITISYTIIIWKFYIYGK